MKIPIVAWKTVPRHIAILVRALGIFVTAVALANLIYEFYPDVFVFGKNTLTWKLIAIYVNIRDSIFAAFSYLGAFLFQEILSIKSYPWFRIEGTVRDFIAICALTGSSVMTALASAANEPAGVTMMIVRNIKPQVNQIWSMTNTIPQGLPESELKAIRRKILIAQAVLFLVLICVVLPVLALALIFELVYRPLKYVLIVVFFAPYLFIVLLYQNLHNKFFLKTFNVEGQGLLAWHMLLHFVYSVVALAVIIFISYSQTKIGV